MPFLFSQEFVSHRRKVFATLAPALCARRSAGEHPCGAGPAPYYFCHQIQLPEPGLADDAAVIAFVVAQIKADLDDFLAWEVEQSDGESESKEVKSEPAFIEMMEGENQLWEEVGDSFEI